MTPNLGVLSSYIIINAITVFGSTSEQQTFDLDLTEDARARFLPICYTKNCSYFFFRSKFKIFKLNCWRKMIEIFGLKSHLRTTVNIVLKI